jgi:hypothetical protein
MFIFPPKIKNIPKSSPFLDEFNWIWTRRFWKCLFYSCDLKNWEPFVREMLLYYDQLLVHKKDKIYLPKGTILYHSSTEYPFLKHAKNKMTFFGLDVVISLWYILESKYKSMDMDCFRHKKKEIDYSGYLYEFQLQEDLEITYIIKEKKKEIDYSGYLYEFQLQEDLEITYIIKEIVNNPKNMRKCSQNPNAVCLHPQVSFHGLDSNYRELPNLFDLCNEVTLFYDTYKDVIGKPINIYLVDTLLLHRHAKNPRYNPTHAVIHRIKPGIHVPRYLRMSCDKYKKYFKNNS